MFFARVKVRSTTESDTFDLKYDLRDMFRQEFKNDNLRHTIMGFVRGQTRIGAKIMMSYPYEDGVIRLWGWIPTSVASQISRTGKNIVDEIYDYLVDVYGEADATGTKYLLFWLDFQSQQTKNISAYMEELLFIKGAK